MILPIESAVSCAENNYMDVDVIEGGVAMDASRTQGRTVTAVRVGIDLVHVPEVTASIAEFGDRYLRRIYSPAEIAMCTSADGGLSAERLAARFAAKEAVVKALRPKHGIDYRTIEVVRDADGVPSIEFGRTGAGAQLLAESGVVSASVSLTHDGDYASAVYMAITETPSTAGTSQTTGVAR
ncbi:MAG: acpS [Ilumatobacteraceae bacterium]|nr:acpS [Ilumatobacteraceae bacterium]MCU1388905.1 acpS [Ilumatobacteraceae bacterium]